MAWLPGWYYRKQITIAASHVDQTLTNFPLRIPLLQTDVIGSQVTGADLRFCTSDGTLLDYTWTGFTDDNYSGAYVKIPTIDATNGATIYVYWGNASATDASNAAIVWADYGYAANLRNYVDGMYDDTGCHIINGSHTDGSIYATSKGVYIPPLRSVTHGNADMIKDELDGHDGFTISICCHDLDMAGLSGWIEALDWIRPSVGYPFFALRPWHTTRYLAGAELRENSGAAATYPEISVTTAPTDIYLATRTQLSTNLFTQSIWRDDGNQTKVVSGSRSGDPVFNFAPSTNLLSTGRTVASCFRGCISDMRIRKGAVSDAWLKFEHANLMNTGGEITLAEEESLPVVAGPYQAAMMDSFQTDALQAETYIPGIITGHTYGT